MTVINHQISLLFPIPVMLGRLDRDFTEEELRMVSEHKNATAINHGNVSSNNSYVLDAPEFTGLKAYLTEFINQYIQRVHSPMYGAEAYITQSWLNYTEHGEYHHKHAHPNSFLSGVVYIDVEPTKNGITFYNPMYKPIVIKSKEYTELNADSQSFSIATKSIVVFPSYLMHAVDKSGSERTRVSLAFNTFLRGKLGEDSSFTGLTL
jgi:uncharacterized protein (TIGR02466 family)